MIIRWIGWIIVISILFYKSFSMFGFESCQDKGGELGLNGGCVTIENRSGHELR